MSGQSYHRSFLLSSSWPEIQMRNCFCILATLVLVFERRQLSCLAFACSEASAPTQRGKLVIQNPGERGKTGYIYRSQCTNQKNMETERQGQVPWVSEDIFSGFSVISQTFYILCCLCQYKCQYSKRMHHPFLGHDNISRAHFCALHMASF